ncbi:MAG: glycosyl hydrolase family 18 protein [Bacteroidota bacterium]
MKHVLLVSFLLISGVISFGQTARTVGYLPTYRFSSSKQIAYCKLTHLNLSFANPDSAGKIVMQDIGTVMSDALSGNPDIIICISFAGAGLTVQQAHDWSDLIDIPSNRPAFIANIVDYVLTNNLKGVDIDLEWGNVTSGYSDFIIELDAALNPHGKILTAAFPNQTLFSNVSTAALDALDFINIMSYDATGPWSPSTPGQHSSLGFSTNGIHFWKNTVGISGDRLTLGVPFYGYDFVNSSTVNDFTYASMVSTNESYADLDNVGTAYYNGRPTMEAKVDLANNEVGGIMIWEVGQDSFDDYSLLKTIHEKYTSLGTFTTGLCGNDVSSSISRPGFRGNYKIYPNPASDHVTIEHEYSRHPEVMITNTLGQVILVEAIQESKQALYFHLRNVPGGMYLVTLSDQDHVPTTQQLIVN